MDEVALAVHILVVLDSDTAFGSRQILRGDTLTRRSSEFDVTLELVPDPREVIHHERIKWFICWADALGHAEDYVD